MGETLPEDSDSSDGEDDFADLWSAWATSWEQEFERLSEAENERLVREAAQAAELAGNAVGEFHASMEDKARRADARAHQIAQLASQEEAIRQMQAVSSIKMDAERARQEAVHDAMQSAGDMAKLISDRAEQRRLEREAKRKEERLKREAEAEARWRQKQGAPAGGASAAGAGAGPGTKAGAPPPRFTRTPGAHADAAGQAQPRSTVAPPPTTAESFEAAWKRFEQELRGGNANIRVSDVPWPTKLATVSGILATDTAKERKTKLREAVLRWHPDKWGSVLPRIVPEERHEAMERVKEVTRRILEERQKFRK